jgi:hypothetical protein
LFFTFGYILILCITKLKSGIKGIFSSNFIAEILRIGSGPIIYTFYFVWFMQQKGAKELQEFMQQFWSSAFIVFDRNIFNTVAQIFHGISVYFFSSYLFLSLGCMLILVFGFFTIFRKRNQPLAVNFLIGGILVHLVLNLLHLYPLSDRLYLYLALPLFLLFIKSLETISKSRTFENYKYILFGMPLLTVLSYSIYFPYRENNIISLYKFLNTHSQSGFSFSPKSKNEINRFDIFTDNYFKNSYRIGVSNDVPLKFHISRVHHKFGHKEKTADEEVSTVKFLNSGRIVIFQKIYGYNIY